MAVDWEKRVDFDRLRAYRAERTRNALAASDLGGLLLFDPNNLRYVTSTAIGTWERDKNIRFALVPQGYLGEALFSRAFFVQLRGSHHTFGSDSDFLQIDTTAERTFDLSPKWHLLLRGEAGASLVSQFSKLPGSVRFFAGGDRSVRGFAFNELSPEEPVLKADGTPELDQNGNPVTVKVGLGRRVGELLQPGPGSDVTVPDEPPRAAASCGCTAIGRCPYLRCHSTTVGLRACLRFTG